jgi:hypothetical protein
MQAVERLVRGYDLTGQPENAAAWRLKLKDETSEKKRAP